MTPDEQIRNQELKILEQRVEIAELKTQVANLQQMHKANQGYIGKLQAQLKMGPRNQAEAIFKN